MTINIIFISPKHYGKKYILQWFWRFFRFTYVNGVSIRILGIEITILEKDATKKLINKYKNK